MRNVFAPVFLLAATLTAQTWSVGVGRMPGTDVYVENDTSDGAPLQLVVNNKDIRGFLTRGADPWHGYFGPGYGDVFIIARACAAVATETVNATGLPEWATDSSIVGEAAITEAFLTGHPSEPTLKLRIEQLEKVLDTQKTLGRKEMKQELQNWFDAVKKIGINRRVAVCENPEDVKIRTRIQFDTFNRLAVPIRIVGDRQHGYRVDGPVDRWY